MYKMDDVYMSMAHMHRNAHKKSMNSEFYLGMQMACEKFLTMMNQTEGFINHPYVEEVTKRIMEVEPALPDNDILHIFIGGKWKDCRGIDR